MTQLPYSVDVDAFFEEPCDAYEVTDDGVLTLAAPYVCDTLPKAAHAARKLRRIRTEQAEVGAMIAVEIARLTAWKDDLCAHLDTSAAHYEGQLRQYLEIQRQADPKCKTVKLPDATCQLRKSPDKYDYEAALDLLIPRFTGTPFVESIPKLKWGELKKHLVPQPDGTAVYDATGEVLEGVMVTPGGASFSVKIVED
jgi:hypothetical protein